MGNGRYSQDSWAATSSARSTKSRAEIFTQRSIHEMFDPKKIVIRESMDSPDNPLSNPIMFVMDVTGSMLHIPDYMARVGIGQLVKNILEKQPVSDPHILVGALGDVQASDTAPLQMAQFEADNRIDEQLVNLYLESGGGGNETESYDLPWAFAALKTKTDAWDKRKKKGYLFTVGDEPAPHRTHTADQLRRSLGTADCPATSEEMLKMAQERWTIFHLVIEEGSRGTSARTQSTWKEMLGPNALFVNDYKQIPSIIPAVIAVAEGKMSIQDAISEAGEAKAALSYTFSRLQEG